MSEGQICLRDRNVSIYPTHSYVLSLSNLFANIIVLSLRAYPKAFGQEVVAMVESKKAASSFLCDS